MTGQDDTPLDYRLSPRWAGMARCRLLSDRSLTYLLLAWIFIALLALQLSGCGSPPKRAPVSSRESTLPRVEGHRPAYYRVQRGDTLFSISWRYRLDLRALAAWNGIRSPYTIYPGQRLRLSSPPRRAGSSRKARVSTNKSWKKPPVSRPAVSKAPIASRGKTKSTKSTSSIESTKALKWSWPTNGRVIEQFSKSDLSRKGVKISGKMGQSVNASASGKVVYAGSGLLGYGRLIIIKHNQNYLSAYGHNRKLLVKEGDTVTKGQRIAEMGSKGAGSPMLHFEIRRNGIPVDPLKLVRRRL